MNTTRAKQPEIGRTVMVNDHLFKQSHVGPVLDLLSTQFTYKDQAGQIRYAFYTDDWSYVNE